MFNKAKMYKHLIGYTSLVIIIINLLFVSGILYLKVKPYSLTIGVTYTPEPEISDEEVNQMVGELMENARKELSE